MCKSHDKFYKKLIKRTKHNFNDKFIKNCKSGKQLWKTMNTLIGNSKKKTRLMQLKVIGEIITGSIQPWILGTS